MGVTLGGGGGGKALVENGFRAFHRSKMSRKNTQLSALFRPKIKLNTVKHSFFTASKFGDFNRLTYWHGFSI